MTITLREALARAVKIADEAWQEWDAAPNGMRAGKIIIALSGRLPGYRADIDEIHAALVAPEVVERATLDHHCAHDNLNGEGTRCLGCGMWAHQLVALPDGVR